MIKTISLILALLIFVPSAFAGGGAIRVGGGGGGGIAEGLQVVLLDFFNEGIEQTAQVDKSNASDEAFWRDLYTNGGLLSLPPSVAQDVVLKIGEVEKKDPFFAAALVEAIKLLSWRFIDAELLQPDDLGVSQSLTGAPIITLAIRQGQTVSISKPSWLKMNETNQAGLILHEVIEALAPVASPPELTRRLVADLFTPSFYLPGRATQWPQALRGFPSKAEVSKTLADGQIDDPYYSRSDWGDVTAQRLFGFAPQNLILQSSSTFYFFAQQDIATQTRHWPFHFSDRSERSQTEQVVPEDFTAICRESKATVQTTWLSIAAYKIQLVAAPVSGPDVPPSLRWSLAKSTVANIALMPGPSGETSCSKTNFFQLSLLHQWSKSFTTFDLP